MRAAGLTLFVVVVCHARADAPHRDPYAGSFACGGCHKQIADEFLKNPHFDTREKTERPPQGGCEGCHGPGREHIFSGGKTPIENRFSQMTAGQQSNACLTCHASGVARASIARSPHAEAGIACTGCHSIHRASSSRVLLRARQTTLCYGCHPAVEAQFSMPSHHRVDEGVMSCTDCHNPHGAFTGTLRVNGGEQLLKQGLGGEEPCLRCHTDKRGPFVFEHAAVQVEGCKSCHVPHGSTNSKLLARPVTFTLCLECHNGAGNFGRSTSGVIMPSAIHNLLDPRFQRCTVCHVRIHGSNSDPFFLR